MLNPKDVNVKVTKGCLVTQDSQESGVQMESRGIWVLKDPLDPKEKRECLETLASWGKKGTEGTWGSRDSEEPQESRD